MKVCFFAACDEANFKYAVTFWKTMTKFHKPTEVDMILFTTEKNPDNLAKLPKGIKTQDISAFIKDDPEFWYRQKPLLAEPLMDHYELVVGFDVDQLILGSLDYVINTKDYDVGTVINWNRADPQMFGFVEIQRLGIAPAEYFNCGMVAMRSKKFVHHWSVLCFSKNFYQSQYREQDMLNVLCYFGNYNVRCLDHGDGVSKYYAWHGLIAKGELSRAIIRGNDIIIPKGFGDTPFPPEDEVLKVVHLGGGAGSPKDNWDRYFSEEVMVKIRELMK